MQEGVKMDNILSKEKFIAIINEIKKFRNFEDSINDFIAKNCDDGYIILPNFVYAIISVLEKMFEDETQWIDYFCWEIEFGGKYEPGMIKDYQGNEIKLQTPEDLYNLLMLELKLKYGGE